MSLWAVDTHTLEQPLTATGEEPDKIRVISNPVITLQLCIKSLSLGVKEIWQCNNIGKHLVNEAVLKCVKAAVSKSFDQAKSNQVRSSLQQRNRQTLQSCDIGCTEQGGGGGVEGKFSLNAPLHY